MRVSVSVEQANPNIGFVAIGRNEGARLERCLTSLLKQSNRIIYVDSGSHDDSVEIATRLDVVVLKLSSNDAFTAARSRNEGFAALQKRWPDIHHVMFIDGDCALADGFPEAAMNMLLQSQDIGIVTGRCRELYPEATIYNRLCEMEWNGPIGEIDACGGIFLIRKNVFVAVNGFNPVVIAAEDDDFCIRARAAGYKIRRLDHDLCFHDADMRRFGQWWRRAVRAGYAYAQVGALHRGYFVGPRRRAWLWGLVLPVVIVFGAPITGGWSLALLALYGLSFVRTCAKLMKEGAKPSHAGLHAFFLTLSKFPNLIGIIDYRRKRLFKQDVAIVEYK